MASNDLTVSEAARRLRAGELTASAHLADHLQRIADREAAVGAWEHLADEAARQAAAAKDAAGAPTAPLHGIPVGVKDIIDVAGMPTSCGSPVRAGHVADADAWCVDRLRTAGAVVLGKTVTTEFAYVHPGKTRNPHAGDHTPGGSSSGSAAAVADRMVGCALGTQTAGSVIRPASFCGVAAFVPTYGRIPFDGVQHLAPALDRLGIFARTAGDLHLVYRILAEGAGELLPRPPSRVLLTDGSALTDVHPAMREAVRHVADTLAGHGVAVEPLDAAELEERCAAAQQVIMAYDAARNLAEVAAAHRSLLSSALCALIDSGSATPEASYRDALETVRVARTEVDQRLADSTVILAPAAPGPAPAGLDTTGDSIMNRPWHVLGLPEATVPVTDAGGLPVGVQLVGAHGADDALLAVTAWVAEQLGADTARHA